MTTYHSKTKEKVWKIQCNSCEIKDNRMILKWSGSPGWGEITVIHNSDGTFFIDDEYMGADFCACVFKDWINTQIKD